MKITFYNANGDEVGQCLSVARDHWDACSMGHEIIAAGRIDGAVDFMVTERPATKLPIMNGEVFTMMRTPQR